MGPSPLVSQLILTPHPTPRSVALPELCFVVFQKQRTQGILLKAATLKGDIWSLKKWLAADVWGVKLAFQLCRP